MKLHLSLNPAQKFFTAHGSGFVAISGERYERPVVVTAEQVLCDWPAEDFAGLEQAHFDYFLALGPEVVLLGAGDRLRFPHPSLYRGLIEAGIGIEFMDTPAACRTYNILVGEDRKVAAAILL